MFFSSDRLIIRKFKETDLIGFHAYRSDPKVCFYQGYEPMDMEACTQFIVSQKDKVLGEYDGWMQLAIVKKENDTIIGDFGVKLMAHQKKLAEIGISLSANEQNKGIAAEALHGFLNFLFIERKVLRVQALVLVENSPAIKVLEKLGFKKEAHFREIAFFNDKWCDEYMFGMLKREWSQV